MSLWRPGPRADTPATDGPRSLYEGEYDAPEPGVTAVWRPVGEMNPATGMWEAPPDWSLGRRPLAELLYERAVN